MSSQLYILTNSSWNAYHFRRALWTAALAQGKEVTAIVPPGAQVSHLRKAGVRVIELQHMKAHGKHPLKDIQLVLELTMLFRKLPPGPIFSFTFKPNLYGGLAARRTGQQFIPTWTGLGYLPKLRALTRLAVHTLLPVSMSKSPKVFFHNRADRDRFIASGFIQPQQGRVVGGAGIDTDYYRQLDWPRDTNSLHILFLGRLLHEKGLGLLVQAIQELRQRGFNIRCRVAGVTSENPNSIDRATLSEWVKSGWFDFVGEVNDVRPHLAWCHCLVLPTYYNEGVPRSILEAMSCGRPVITTDIPGCRDAVSSGVTGWLIPPNSVALLQTALQELYETDSIDRARMGKSGRDVIRKFFSREVVLRQYGLLEDQNIKSGIGEATKH